MAVVGSIVVEYLAKGAKAFIAANREVAVAMGQVETKAQTVQGHLQGMVAPLAKASKTVVRIGDNLVHAGQVFASFAYRMSMITLPITGFLVAAGKAGMELEYVMAKVQAELPKGQAAIEQFTAETTQAIVDLSTRWPIAADDIAEAMYMLISSMTIDPETARAFLEPMTMAATAGDTTAKTVAEAVSVIMNAYKMMADSTEENVDTVMHIMDVLFAARARGRAEYEDFVRQVGDFIAMAKRAGATFEEAMAVYAEATRITSPAIAATWIKRLYAEMTRPKFMDAMKEFGIQMFKWEEGAEGVVRSIRPSIDILRDLGAVLAATKDEQEKLNMVHEAFGRITAVQGFLVFLENLVEVQDWVREFEESVGLTAETAKIMLNTVKSLLLVFRNVTIAIGEDIFLTYKEDIKRFLVYLADVFRTLREMEPEIKKQMFAWLAFLSALGPVALVFSTILMGLGSLIAMLGALISPPVLGAVIAGVLLFGDELGVLWDVLRGISWQEIIVALLDVGVSLGLISRTNAGEVMDALGISIEEISLEKIWTLRDGILGLVDKFREIRQVGSDALAVVREFLDMVADRVGVVGSMVGLLGDLASAFVGLVGGKAPEMGGVETETWAKLLDLMLGLGIAIKVLPALFAGLSAAVSWLAPLLLGIVGAVAGLNPLVLAAAAAVGTLFVAFGDWAAATEVLSDIFGPLIERVREFVGGLIDAFYEGGLAGAFEYFKVEWSGFAEDIKVLIGEAADKSLVALGDFFAGWLAFLQENAPMWAENVKTWLVYIWESAIDWMREHVPEWIERTGTTLKDWISGAIDWLGEHVPEWIEAVSTVLGDWIEGAIQYVGDHYEEWGVSIAEFLGEMVGHVLTFLTEKLPEWEERLIAWFAELLQALIDWVGENWEEWAKQLGQFLWDMAVAMVDFQIVKLPELVAALLKWFADMWVGFIAGLVETGPTWLKELISWFQISVWDPFVLALETTFALVGAGKALIQGLIDGITAKATDLINAARGVVNDAIQAAKNLLRMESASKVFFEIGSAMMLGLVQGVEAGAPAVQNALGQILSGVGALTGPAWHAGLQRFFDALDAFISEFVSRAEVWRERVNEQTVTLAGWIGETVASLTAAIDPLIQLADYGPDQAAFRAGVDAFFANLEYFLDEFAWGMWRFEKLATEKAARTAELCGRILGALGEAIQPLLDLADYAPDQAAFRAGVGLFFANLEYFLDEFAWGLWRFEKLAGEKAAGVAELMEQIVGALGSTIQPLLDLAEYSVTPAEFARAADLFFDHLARFIEMFAERAEAFEANVSEEVAKLAETIGATMTGIGAAVQPLLDILAYAPEVEDIGARFEHFFYHLGMVLYYIEQAAQTWRVSDAAKALAEAVGQVTSDLSSAVGFLRECAEYGTDHSAFALLGFIHFLDDLKAIIFLIAEAGAEMVDAIPLAEAWAAACCEVLANLQRGIDKLNELAGLGVAPENLVEAGRLLVQSLADGFVEALDSEWGRMLAAFSDQFDAFVNNWLPECMRVMHDRGWNIGANLIWGMIEGLASQASALYDTVWQIVQNAIATAEAAAEASSESRSMRRLGANMVRGLISGIGSQRAALAATLAGLADYGGFSLQPALAGMGAGASGGQVVHHHYEYNISPRYEQVQSPADIRRDIEALDWARRHYRV